MNARTLPLLLLVLLALSRPAFAQERFQVDLRALPDDVGEEEVRSVRGLRYSSGMRKLIWQSDERMSLAVRDQLLGLSDDGAWQAAVNALYEQAKPVLESGGGGQFQLEAEDFPIRALFVSLAEQYKLNLVLPPELEGSVSVQLKDIAPRDAIEQIARTAGFTCVEAENSSDPSNPIIRLVPVEEAEAEQEAEDARRQTRIFRVSEDTDLDDLLDGLSALVSDDGRVAPNRQARIVMVNDRADALALMEQYIKAVRDALDDEDEDE